MLPARSSTAGCSTPTPPPASRPRTAGQPAGATSSCSARARHRRRLPARSRFPGDDEAAGALVQICLNGGRASPGSPRTLASTRLEPAGRHLHRHGVPRPRSGFVEPRSRTSPRRPGTTATRTSSSARCRRRRRTGRRSRASAANDDGLPVAYWTDPLDLVTTGCPGASATYLMVLEGHTVRSGPLTETPAGSGTTRPRSQRSRRITATARSRSTSTAPAPPQMRTSTSASTSTRAASSATRPAARSPARSSRWRGRHRRPGRSSPCRTAARSCPRPTARIPPSPGPTGASAGTWWPASTS